MGRFAADHPAHRRIAAQPIGVVHILVTSQPAEYRLPQQPDQQVASVPASARLCQSLAAAFGQCEHVVQLAIRQQSAIGGDRRAVEPEHHSPVEIEPHFYSVPHRFARREVEVRLTPQTVEIFLRGERIAAHRRSSSNQGTPPCPSTCHQATDATLTGPSSAFAALPLRSVPQPQPCAS